MYSDIADADGKLDKQKVCRNANMRTMILDGWTWVLLPAELDEIFCRIRTFKAQALRSQVKLSWRP